MGKVLFFLITAIAAVCAGDRAGALVWHFARPEFLIFMAVGVAGHFVSRPIHGLTLSLLAGAGAVFSFSPSGIPWGTVNSLIVLVVSQLFWRLSEQEGWGSDLYGRIPTSFVGFLFFTAAYGFSFGPVIAVVLALQVQAIRSAGPQLKVAACTAALLGAQNPLTNPLLGGWSPHPWMGLMLVVVGVVAMSYHLITSGETISAGNEKKSPRLSPEFLGTMTVFVGLQVATTVSPLPPEWRGVFVWTVFCLVVVQQLDKIPKNQELVVLVRGPLGFASLGLVGWAFAQSAGKFQVGGLELFLIPLLGGWFSSGATSAVLETAPSSAHHQWVGGLLPMAILLCGSMTRIGDMVSWVTNTQLTPEESRDWLKGRFLATQAGVMLAWALIVGYFYFI